MKGKDYFHVCQKIKNMKINCKLHKLLIVTKKITTLMSFLLLQQQQRVHY